MKTKKLLVVDDSLDVREAIVRWLRRAAKSVGVEVLEASSAQEALEIVLREIEVSWFVVTDHAMPERSMTDVVRDGGQLIMALRQHDGFDGVLILASGSILSLEYLKAVGPTHFFDKPVEMSHLMKIFQEFLDRQ